ncbi:hypothetical protein TNCT_371201 [Trichonephila clavata]|uniref:Uncharacterized protein n=1 Tax=Trichonephila clavata TaxID=2740835 RepID=A0A8X6F736_TRICU|nr:hypothetical protein TNCT_371201 [Trichonephila clavata]
MFLVEPSLPAVKPSSNSVPQFTPTKPYPPSMHCVCGARLPDPRLAPSTTSCAAGPIRGDLVQQIETGAKPRTLSRGTHCLRRSFCFPHL